MGLERDGSFKLLVTEWHLNLGNTIEFPSGKDQELRFEFNFFNRCLGEAAG